MPRREGPKSSPSSAEAAVPASLRSARPWGDFAKKYFDAGWCPLPLPPRKKSSPPSGTTGKFEMPDKKQIAGWHKQRDGRCNIALRMPDDIIGIDVDAYGEKIGRQGLAELEGEFGALPPTWTLTARSDSISGIRFFRVPAGLHWPGEPVKDVQIVQNHHRYAVAYPSVHPDTKKTYLWYAPGDLLNGRPQSVSIEHEIPGSGEISELPTSWVEGLTGGRVWTGLRSDLMASPRELGVWVKARPGGEMCRLMRKQAKAAVDELSSGVGGAHDALNSRLYAVISLATEGHSGVLKALGAIRTAFTAEVTRPGRKGRRSEADARGEYFRARDGAIRIMMASVADGESSLEEDCGCAGSSLQWGEQLGVIVEEEKLGSDGSKARRVRIGKAKAADKYTYDDSGNAEHLLDILDGSAYYIANEKRWYFWSPGVGSWQTDPDSAQIWEIAQIIGKRCRELSDEYTERLVSQGSSVALDVGGDLSVRIAQLDKHAKLSSDRRGLENMVKIASVQSRAKRPAEDFDRDPTLLACPNGTIVLGKDSAVFRVAVREDFCAHNTGTPYVVGATSSAWEDYLARFLPSPAIRRYAQKVAGYSLLGMNPERKMFVLQGDTSTGKTTFANALSACLGQYAGTMNLSLFRDNQDEKPRPDLVGAVTKRVLTASESSPSWQLHGDQVKRLTGGDPIKARMLNSNNYVDRKPAFTPWIVTNSFPSVHGVDKALWRRLVCIPFREVIAEGDEDFAIEAALLREEGRSAVLAWAVRGWELYREDGSLSAPDEVLTATADMLAQLSELDTFLSETVVVDSDGRVPFTELWSAWQMYVAEGDVDIKMSKKRFGMELTGRGYGTLRTRINGESLVVRTGIARRI